MTQLEAPSRGAALAALVTACLWAVHTPATWAQGQPTATDRAATRAADRSAVRSGDYIAAIVNQELVTAVEVSRRMARAREDAQRAGARLPADEELRNQVLEALIEERVILTYARETGGRVDDAELDRAVQTVAAQNQLSVPQLRERLAGEGIDLVRFRANLRDQLLVERTREREVYQRIRITDSDVEDYLERQRRAAAAEAPLNLAQILISVPEGASEAVVAERRRLAEAALARVRAGEPFEAVARQLSEDAQREKGGEIGARPVSRLPDLFVEATRSLKVGEVTPALVRSAAAFHVLKVLSRGDVGPAQVTQTRSRHILLRPSSRLTAEAAQARLAGYRRQIESGARTFEDMAREFSEDGSAAQGGDLGWAAPGTMVPEFEEAMNALPLGGLSQPVVSRFGAHLIQVLERREVAVDPKQLREQARNALREQRFDDAYTDWARDLRGRAYVERREPPL
ncbi:MAG: peptidylprolyl isomerase [Rubrivivax sp.]|jgi:peptidyl-prolyl cis-trans isomerase SurA|nr:peptidylprolyl isomerase [Rubrivivax sp.]